MKRLITILLLGFIAPSISAQTDIVNSGLNKPFGVLLYGNDLYIAEYNGGKISKIDITAISPTPTDVVMGLDKPCAMVRDGNYLYISEFGANKVSRIDLNASHSHHQNRRGYYRPKRSLWVSRFTETIFT